MAEIRWPGWWLSDTVRSLDWFHLADGAVQETLNYWKQLSHVMKYFRAEEDPSTKLPNNFMTGFLEV